MDGLPSSFGEVLSDAPFEQQKDSPVSYKNDRKTLQKPFFDSF